MRRVLHSRAQRKRQNHLSVANKNPIAIIGAGPAGVAAAVAAASKGANVLLIEASARLGGSVTAAMHRSLCGLYEREPHDPLDTLNTGVQRDVIAHMLRIAPGQVIPRQFGQAWVLEFPSASYEQSLAKLLGDAKVQPTFNTRVVAVHRDANRITGIQLQGEHTATIAIRALIDCTGTGKILELAGPDVCHPPDASRMLAGYALRLANLTGDTEMLRLQVPYALAKAVQQGDLPPTAKFTVLYPGPGANEAVLKFAADPDSTDAPETAARIFDQLKAQLPDFANARIIEQSPHILPRDGSRLLGRSMLTGDDVLLVRKIAEPNTLHAWWPIERWDRAQGPTYAYPPPGDHYDIPLAALQSARFENLFAAGACISTTASAAASARASGICLATGEAAGHLATSS